MKFVKKEKTEPRYFVPEIAQAIYKSEGTIRGYFANKSRKKSTEDGLTLDEICAVLERPRTRGDGIDWSAVLEIKERLFNEKGYVIEKEPFE